MAQIWVTGPAAIWVSLPGSDTPVFLGHGEEPPKVREQRYWYDVHCDIAGVSAIFDKIYQGRSVTISIDVIRYNLDIMELVRSYPNSVADPGVDVWGSRGTLMVQELGTMKMWLSFPYSAKASMNGLPRGLTFPNCIVEGPDEYEMGTRPKKIRTMFHCLPRYRPSDGAFVTYTKDDFPAAIPNFPPN